VRSWAITLWLNIFSSDWIAVNVLRSVALSTNSVAASVEPVMHQQFFSLSPMAGQESFNAMDVRPHHQVMAHTPTTSSMLAALQHDSFSGGSLDPTSSAFSSDAYGLSYMDTSTPQDDPVHQPGLSFSDSTGSSNFFDVGAFTPQDLNMSTSATPASEADHDSEPVKSEV
jgi:regulatory factor X